MAIIEARLVNLKFPTLIFDKKYIDNGQLKKNQEYLIEFLNLDEEIMKKVLETKSKFNFFVEKHDNEKSKIELRTKVMGFLNLKYQQNYKIKLTIEDEI